MSKEPRGFRRVSKRAAGISQWGGKLIGRPQSQSLSLSLSLSFSLASILPLSDYQRFAGRRRAWKIASVTRPERSKFQPFRNFLPLELTLCTRLPLFYNLPIITTNVYLSCCTMRLNYLNRVKVITST